MVETAKAHNHRIRDGWFEKYTPNDKIGIDIGCGDDVLLPCFRCYDASHGDGDATFMGSIDADSYDVVYASHVLEHLVDPVLALKNWWRILKPRGHLIILAPHRDMYEKKKTLPSNWNSDHKSYWLPEFGENKFTYGLKETVIKAIPQAEIISLCILDEGFKSDSNSTHSHGEYSIEIIVKKN